MCSSDLETASVLPGAADEGALGRALRKVRERLGGSVEVAGEPPEFTAAVQEAARRGEALDITYWTASRDEVTERRIVPRHVFTDHGDYFVVADDDRSGEERVFRIDRIHALQPTGVLAPPREVTGWKGSWFEGDNVPLAVLRLDASARWVAERYPVRSTTELPDGGLEVVLPVATERWLARLLLRLGTRGSVVSPAEWEHLGADAAASVLARYERS